MIHSATFEVHLRGLKIETQAELDGFTKLIQTVMESYHPESMFITSQDVDVKLVNAAGEIAS